MQHNIMHGDLGWDGEDRKSYFDWVQQRTHGKFGAWEGFEFCPETDFLAKLAAIEGISCVESQTFTFMAM